MTKSDMKQTWTNINAILGRTKDKHDFHEKCMLDEKEITGNMEIANKFNYLYTNIGPTLDSLSTVPQCKFINGTKYFPL